MKIEMSVGHGKSAPNKKADVLIVQKLLNATVVAQVCSPGTPAGADRAAMLFRGDAIPALGPLRETGVCDPKTVAAIVWFQKNVLGAVSPDGIVRSSGPTLAGLNRPNPSAGMTALIARLLTLSTNNSCTMLTEDDFKAAAKDLGVDVASVKAVEMTESAGSGFIEDGRPLIRFEAHKFSQFTKHFYDQVYPNISVRVRTDSLVHGGVAGRKREYDRLQKAMVLDREAALRATSWGRFQVLGDNFAMLDMKSADAIMDAAYKSDADQLRLFTTFVKKKGLAEALKQKDWTSFANGYNGKYQHGYDTRISKNYQKVI